jgi:hypothetical protein
VQLQGISNRRAHHVERSRLIWEEEEDSGKRSFWVFLVWPRAPSLASSGGFFSVRLFIGAWHELEKRRVHCRLRIQSFSGLVLRIST